MPSTVMTATEGRLEGAGRLLLFYRTWRPAAPPLGAVVIVHGFNAHSGHYAWAAEQLTTHRFAVYAPDLRLKNEDFLHNPKIVAEMNADPLITDEAQPTKTVAAMVRADEQPRERTPAHHVAAADSSRQRRQGDKARRQVCFELLRIT